MSLEKLTKNELQAIHEQKIGPVPAGASKAELLDALEKHSPEKPEEEVSEKEAELLDASESKVEEVVEKVAPGVIHIIKINTEGRVYDRQTITRDAWAVLPDHKYGWIIEPPTEAQ